MNDKDLWINMLAGKKEALETIFRIQVQPLFDYGRKFTDDVALVEDCIQNLFTDIWVKRANLKVTDHIRPYLMLSLRRRILRERKNQQKTELMDREPFFLEVSPDSESELIESEKKKENTQLLQNALNSLSSRQREIIYLKFDQNLSSQEIAELLQMNNQSVRNAIHRSLVKLKKLMISLIW